MIGEIVLVEGRQMEFCGGKKRARMVADVSSVLKGPAYKRRAMTVACGNATNATMVK